MGQQPRKFDPLKAQMLANLAEMLVRQLEYRWVMALQARKWGWWHTAMVDRVIACWSLHSVSWQDYCLGMCILVDVGVVCLPLVYLVAQ